MPRWVLNGPTHWALLPDKPAMYQLARVYIGPRGWTATIYIYANAPRHPMEVREGFATEDEAKAWALATTILT